MDTTGKIFDRAVASIKANETDYIIKKFDPEGHEYGSHIKQVNTQLLMCIIFVPYDFVISPRSKSFFLQFLGGL